MNAELKKYENVIKPLLSRRRFEHSVNVADMSLKLAKKFGADEDKCYVAGILHDCRKEVPDDIMLEEVKKSGFYVDPVELSERKLWHAIAGACYAKNVVGITDPEILSAIRFHTVAKADMTRVEQIVYLADITSADRDYEDADKYRKLVLDDLNNGMFAVLRWSILSHVDKKNTIPMSTFEAYNFYAKYAK